ncbi:MAG TPA: hypothetical protein PLQ56_21430 [Aggregatilineales bacterium]|nr:hypothetical protein [Aggregatilineales bacterium]
MRDIVASGAAPVAVMVPVGAHGCAPAHGSLQDNTTRSNALTPEIGGNSLKIGTYVPIRGPFGGMLIWTLALHHRTGAGRTPKPGNMEAAGHPDEV